jgi:hypothetical protein
MVDGAHVSDGTMISAWNYGSKYAEVGSFTSDAKSVYILDVPADNPQTAEKDGGEEGDMVVFKTGSMCQLSPSTWKDFPPGSCRTTRQTGYLCLGLQLLCPLGPPKPWVWKKAGEWCGWGWCITTPWMRSGGLGKHWERSQVRPIKAENKSTCFECN